MVLGRAGQRCRVVADEIDDPMLNNYLLKGGVTPVGELYEVVASLEVTRGIDKKVAGSAIRRMFACHFPKRSWTVPETIEGWENHIEALPRH